MIYLLMTNVDVTNRPSLLMVKKTYGDDRMVDDCFNHITLIHLKVHSGKLT